MRSSFSFDYTPNLADAKFGIRLSMWGSTGRKLRTLGLGFVFTSAGMTALLSVGRDGDAVSTAAVGGVAFGAVWSVLFFTAFNAWLARWIVARHMRNGATQRILVDADAVEHRNAVSAYRVSWSAVTSVREFDRAFLLMTGDRPIGSIEKAGDISPSDLDELRRFIESIKPLETGQGLALGPL